jgi:hypothetical protein
MAEPVNNSTSPCHDRKIPLWLVLLDNVPTLVLFILGIIIISQISATGAIFYGFYAIFSVAWFWARICPYCHHYDTQACPCGYGAISSKLFIKGTGKSFRKVFRRNISIQFPNWFIPLAVSIYLMSTHNTKEIVILTGLFVLIGFLIIPVVSKLVGCKNCAIKEDCPWMATSRKSTY